MWTGGGLEVLAWWTGLDCGLRGGLVVDEKGSGRWSGKCRGQRTAGAPGGGLDGNGKVTTAGTQSRTAHDSLTPAINTPNHNQSTHTHPRLPQADVLRQWPTPQPCSVQLEICQWIRVKIVVEERTRFKAVGQGSAKALGVWRGLPSRNLKEVTLRQGAWERSGRKRNDGSDSAEETPQIQCGGSARVASWPQGTTQSAMTLWAGGGVGVWGGGGSVWLRDFCTSDSRIGGQKCADGAREPFTEPASSFCPADSQQLVALGQPASLRKGHGAWNTHGGPHGVAASPAPQ